MNWIPLSLAAATPPAAPMPIQDIRVSNQQIDVTLAGNLNLGSIFTGSVSASDVGYWLDAMAYSDQYEQVPGPAGTVLGNRYGYGLRIMFRVRQLSPKASLNYGLIGASVEAGFAQASYEINAFGFGAQASQALATILGTIAASGSTLDSPTFYALNSSILKNLVTYLTANQLTMQPVRVATLVTSTVDDNTFNTSHSVLFAMRQIASGRTAKDALSSPGDFDTTGIQLAYEAIVGDSSSDTVPSGANENAANQWLADN